MIDTHCHLDACEPPVAELVDRARRAGVTRLATVGMNGPSIEHAIMAAEDHDEVLAIVDEVELTAALDAIWRRIKRLNRYVTDEEPWQLAKDDANADALNGVLYSLAEGLRVVSVLLHPFMPASAERLLAAIGRPDLSLDGAELGAVGGGAKVGELGQLFPRVEAEAPAA